MPIGPRTTLNDLKVLSLLYRDMGHEHYGLSISKALRMGNGTLYPILDKLEDGGLITAKWEDIDPRDAGRRPRRFYNLTSEGIELYERERAQFVHAQSTGVSHV